MSNLPVKLRNPLDDDFNFIINSWLKSYRNSPFATHIPNEIYFRTHGAIIKDLLTKGRVLIICSTEDDHQILGYVVYETRENILIIHFVYLKYTYRRLGLMKSTLQQVLTSLNYTGDPIFITHLPRGFETLKVQYPYVYNPYFLRTE